MVSLPVPTVATIPGAQPPNVSRFERLSFAVLAALAVVYVMVIFVKLLPTRATTWDFSHYYTAATVLREGGDPYTSDLRPLGARLGLKIDQINRGTYPPTFIWCFSPLTRLPVQTAFIIWQALSIACLSAGLILLMRELVSSRAAGWLLIGVAFFAPVQMHLAFSQSQFMVFLMLVLMIRALEHGREAEAGLILALAALLRAYPLAIAGYLVVRRHWRALGWMVCGIAVGGAITVAAVGLKTCLDFRYVPALITQRYFLENPSNIALASFIARMFWRLSDYGLIGSHESLRKAISFAVCAAVGIFVLVRTWTRDANENEPDTDRRAYSLWIATMILISPTAWDHYLVLLLLPFIQITAAAAAGRAERSVVMMCIASYLLADIGFFIFAPNGFADLHSFLPAELGFMSAAAAWAGMVLFARTPATLTIAHLANSTTTANQSTAPA